VQLTERDFVSACFVHMRARRSIAVLGFAVLALALLAEGLAAYKWMRHGGSPWSLIVLNLALILVFAYFVWYIPWRARRTFRLFKAASEPFTLGLTPEGLRWESSLGGTLVPWPHIHRWREGRELFLLYPADILFYVVPKRFFDSSDQVAAFRSALETHKGPAA
jgi:hypothetical protein